MYTELINHMTGKPVVVAEIRIADEKLQVKSVNTGVTPGHIEHLEFEYDFFKKKIKGGDKEFLKHRLGQVFSQSSYTTVRFVPEG